MLHPDNIHPLQQKRSDDADQELKLDALEYKAATSDEEDEALLLRKVWSAAAPKHASSPRYRAFDAAISHYLTDTDDTTRADALRMAADAWRPFAPPPAVPVPLNRLPEQHPDPLIRYAIDANARGALLTAGTVTVLTGEGGMGKSLLTLQLALAASRRLVKGSPLFCAHKCAHGAAERCPIHSGGGRKRDQKEKGAADKPTPVVPIACPQAASKRPCGLVALRKSLQIKGKNGGAEGARTPDLVTASHALSQLSYSPT